MFVGVSLLLIPSTSLLLNIVVSAIAFFNFARAGYFAPKIILPFLTSVPFAFLAGTLVLPVFILAMIFVVALLAASVSLLLLGSKISAHRARMESSRISSAKVIAISAPVGATLGTVAGVVGIGGGIWLSPLLILTGLANSKQAGAAAALFILLNSVSGFLANSIAKPVDYTLLLPLAFCVAAGGLIGSRYGAFKLNLDRVRIIVGLIVAVAALLVFFRFFVAK